MNAISDTESSEREPIAVIGIGCRFAGGVDGPDALWQLLEEKRDGIISVPADRWDSEKWYNSERDHPGTMNMTQAGFLEDGIDRFDAGFFGIAPREAATMDPHQRLFLEVSHQALEDAGIIADSLAGTRTAIFAGAYNANYSLMARGAPDPALIDGWSATGGHASVIAGRLAYYLGTTGPALVVDTACSSSLVAIHMAVRSLRAGECDLAIVGGVHLMTAPEPLVASTKLGATAPDGHCKPFDASADGFGHGEGAGVIILKRLSDADVAHDRVIAVIRGSAVNQDGRSNSLTAPNGPSQENVITEALRDAGVRANQVGFVEAHGTGTPLGDPIEIEAVARSLDHERSGPVLVGSVKANLGHTEAAAGIAGLIKALLVVNRGIVPPQAGFSVLNPEIDLLDAPIVVPQQSMVLETIEGRRIAGVSAFGFAGTNAHVIVESHQPLPAAMMPSEDAARTLAISARTAGALETAVAQWKQYLQGTGNAFRNITYTSTARRHAFPHRVAVTADTALQASEALDNAVCHHVTAAPRVAFIFTGQGSQYAGMARGLYDGQRIFRQALDRNFTFLDPLMGINSKDTLFGETPIERTDLAQPLIVAVELALAEFWRAAGIQPVAVLGHSVGEFAAAAISGAITNEDALRLAATRGKAMQALPSGGGMMAVFSEAAEVLPYLDRVKGVLAIAAINGPRNTVVSGEADALDRLGAMLDDAGVDTHRLAVSHAFHSPLIEPCLPKLARAAGEIVWHKPQMTLVSNLTGRQVENLGVDYWLDHAKNPVRFAEGIRHLETHKVDVLLEIGPDSVLSAMAAKLVPDCRQIASLRRGLDDGRTIAAAATELYLAGVHLNWEPLFVGSGAQVVGVPPTPFERSRYWLDVPASGHMSQSDTQSKQIETDARGSAVIYDFYDELTVLSQNYSDAGDDGTSEEGHLTFGFLPQPDPNFSWVRSLFEKDIDPQGHERLRQTQRALKDVLFADLDFDRISTVFDYGCGHAADLASMMLEHPHLTGRGFTVSAGQVAVGRKRLNAMGLGDRVKVDRADSSKVPFPQNSDLIFGVEVTGLIADKEGLFANIAGSLRAGGLLVIADFVSTGDAIVNPQTHSYTPSARDWAELLGGHGLRLVRAVDASREVANWLDDVHFAQNVDALVAKYDLSELTKRHLLSNGNIGGALRADLMQYMLLRAIASPHENRVALTSANLAMLEQAGSVDALSDEPSGKDWMYRIENRPAQSAANFDLTVINDAVGHVAVEETLALAQYSKTGQVLDDLSRQYIIAAFLSMGARHLSDVASLTVAPEHKRLVDHLVRSLADHGIGQLDGQGDIQLRLRDAMEQHPEAAGELQLLGRCGPKLDELLQGRLDPLELLFPGGDTALAEALYEHSPFSAAVQRMVAAAGAALPRDVPVNAIEIGGGTGATTAHLLKTLPPGSSYLFTDIGAALVARAEVKFAGTAIATSQFDIERPASSQNIAEGDFDMAVAANVLHATSDISATLRNVHDLLSPGGLLMLVENAGQILWGDLTFGLTAGMWAFTDTSTRDHALLSPAAWRRHLEDAGFEAIEFHDPGHEGIAGVSQQIFILARKCQQRRFAILGAPRAVTASLEQSLVSMGHGVDHLSSETSIPDFVTDLIYVGGLQADCSSEQVLLEAHSIVKNVASAKTQPRICLIATGQMETAALTGFGRGVSVELPDTHCRCITLDANQTLDAQSTRLATAIVKTRGDVALTGTANVTSQLILQPADNLTAPRLDGDAIYLVTGAYGGLGPLFVRWLYERGARNLVLAGRRPPSQATRMALDGIEARLETVDVSDPDALERLIALATSIAPLKGVFHATGALADGALINQSADDVLVPLKSKLSGALALDRLTRDISLDHFVLFSSAAGLLAPFGQANHAAANSALDQLALQRRLSGRVGLSVDWGAFAQAGAAVQPGIEEHVSETGLGFMPPEAAFAMLGHAMMQPEAQVAILDADWQQYRKRFSLGGIPFLLQSVCRSKGTQVAVTSSDPVDVKSWLSVIETAPQSHRADLLCDLIRAEVAAILRVGQEQIDDDKPLREAGLDSLMSIELRKNLSNAVAIRLGATLVFDYPSVRALSHHLGMTAFPDLFEPAQEEQVETDTGGADLDVLDADSLSALLAAELGEDVGRG